MREGPAALEPDTLAATLRAGSLRLAHTESEGRLVLLGTTADLRAALTPYLERPGVLQKPGVWRRRGLPPGGGGAGSSGEP